MLGLLTSKRPDFIFVESPPLSASIPAFLASSAWKAPVVFNVSDIWPDSAIEFQLMGEGWLMRRARTLERWSYRRAKYVCAVNEGIRDALLHKGVPAEKVLSLPNGVDSELFVPMAPDNKLRMELGLAGKHVVLYAGTMGYAQNLESLLRAAALLRSDTTIQFVLVGGGSMKSELMSLARQWQLPNVSFYDPVPPDQISRWFSIALCGVVSLADKPILHTARPAKAGCIMACAKPVLLAMGGKARHFIQDIQAGITVPVGQPEEMAKAISFLVANPAEAARLGENGRRYALANLSWRRLVGDFLNQLTAAELGCAPTIVDRQDSAAALADRAA